MFNPLAARPQRLASYAVLGAVAFGLAVPAQAAMRTTLRTRSISHYATTPVLAPAGQTTVTSGFLPASALSFAGVDTGWVSYNGGVVAQLPTIGDLGLGSLAVTFGGTNGSLTGASSPHFAVVPGARYSATGEIRALTTAHTVALAIRFYDANGTLINGGSVGAQGIPDSVSAWTQTLPVIGFAPANAASADIVFQSYDALAGETHLLDDLSISQTTGVAAPFVTPLSTSGRYVVDGAGHKVVFRGIDVNGLQYSNVANVTTSEITQAQQWGANFIRLPLGENYVIPGDCLYDGNYLNKVDALVQAATSRGLFIMLDLHTNNVLGDCTAPIQQKMPDQKAVTFWTTVAKRYASNPLVGFDLYNEPHDISDALWHNGGTVSSGGATYTAPGMQKLYSTVRAVAPKNLIFASGTGWATNFPYTSPLTSTTNLIYAAHAYTCPNGTQDSGATCSPGPNGVLDPSGILTHFDTIAQTKPVVVTEFGYPSKGEGRYTTNLINYVTSHDWSGWDVYAFDNSNTGMFDLVKTLPNPNDPAPIDPAPSGMAVMMGMLNG